MRPETDRVVNRALLEVHFRQAMDNAARNPKTWRSMLDLVVDGCADALDAALREDDPEGDEEESAPDPLP